MPRAEVLRRSLTASMFAMPSRGHPWVWAGIAAVLALQGFFVHAAPPLPVVPVIEAEKRWCAA